MNAASSANAQLPAKLDAGWQGAQPTDCMPTHGSTLPRCVIVGLNLTANGLAGTLRLGRLCGMSHLQMLQLGGNSEGLGGSPVAQQLGLQGTASDCLPALRVLDLSHNGLVGGLPFWLVSPQMLSHLEMLELEGNDFRTPPEWDDGGGSLQETAEGAMSMLSRQCLRGGPSGRLSCTGLPPPRAAPSAQTS